MQCTYMFVCNSTQCILTKTTPSLAAMARISAQDTVLPPQAASTRVLMVSMTSNPLAEFRFGNAFFSPVKVGVSSSSIDASQPCMDQSNEIACYEKNSFTKVIRSKDTNIIRRLTWPKLSISSTWPRWHREQGLMVCRNMWLIPKWMLENSFAYVVLFSLSDTNDCTCLNTFSSMC